MPTGCLRGGLRWVFPPVFSPGSSRLKLPAMVGLALGRETLGTSLLEECLELSQQPEEEGVYFCHKQEDIQKLSSLDQRTCLCKGKLILNTFFSHHTRCLLNRVTTKKSIL